MPIVRRMTALDVGAIAMLEKVTFSDPWSEKSIYDTCEEEHSIVLVVEKDENIVGYCIAYSVLDEAEIARIAVDKSFRRQGIGQRLLEQLVQICKEKEILHLMLEVREGNDTARAFYRANGFDIDGVRKNYYQFPTENAVLMSMVIPTVPTRN